MLSRCSRALELVSLGSGGVAGSSRVFCCCPRGFSLRPRQPRRLLRRSLRLCSNLSTLACGGLPSSSDGHVCLGGCKLAAVLLRSSSELALHRRRLSLQHLHSC